MPAPNAPVARSYEMPTVHPMDSSRLFQALLNFVRESEGSGESAPRSQIISVPTLRRLLSAIHFRDAGTLKHSRRVGLISVGIAARLGWDEDDLRIIEIAALLHDIGKIGIPDHVLRKPGRLSPDEAEYIAVHHRVALGLLQACHVHPQVTDIVAQSHGVDATDASHVQTSALGARILAVADAYDSLTTRQCYRAPYDRWEALHILEEQSGKQFDRNVVAALGRWLDGPDAALLADERAAEVSIQVNAPVDVETRSNAGQLCQIFNHLYLLESLYDAFYIIDSSRRILVWSSGAAKLFSKPVSEVLQTRWTRQLIAKSPPSSDPLEAVFLTGQTCCHAMTVQDPGGTFLDVDVQAIPIQSESGQVLGVIELICNGKESKQYRGQFRSLQIAATRDPLTGVLNRGELEKRLAECHDHWLTQPNEIYSVMFLDLDHFKAINDNISHAVGDRVLTDVARMLQDELYSGEIVGRYGGEEFVIICPQSDLQTTVQRAERIRRVIQASVFADRPDLRVTASFGVSQIEQGDTVETVVARADQALYDAKRQGRNCTCVRRVTSRASAEAPHHDRRQQFEFSAEILTCVASDMLPLKLKGFVEEHGAKILSVDDRQVMMQIGSSGVFGTWRNGGRLPVRVKIDIHDPTGDERSARIKRKLLKTCIEPVGRPGNAELFQNRAAQVMEQLRCYLMAD
ncbi:diguanylate cyclase [Planctomicrobium sp. SH664]|uniref:diguanylate cyclase n=1 Tax=Planctomicrobium sp. SH664 TaxID=3448125 RepID=UPI003F5C7246